MIIAIVLQQSTTFKPFMWKFRALPMIARGASQDDEVDIMSRPSFSTTYRNRVLKMVDVSPVALLKFSMTARGIVASIVLSLQFLLYLLRRQRAFYCPFACPVSMHAKAAYHLAMFCFSICMSLTLMSPIILPVVFKIMLMVLSVILSCLLKYPLTVLLTIFALLLLMSCIVLLAITTALLSVGHIIAAVSLVLLFPMGVVVGSHMFNSLLSMADIRLPLSLNSLLSMLSIISLLMLNKMLSVGFVVFSLSRYYLFSMSSVVLPTLLIYLFFVFLVILLALLNMSIIIGFTLAFSAFLAHCAKSIFSSGMLAKELKSSREHLTTGASTLLAGIIVLGYYIGHGTSSNLVSSPGVFQHSLDTPFLPLHYTIHPPVAQLQGVY